jgi:hypothetical protein
LSRIKLAICIYEVSIQAFGPFANSGIVPADRETKVIAGLSRASVARRRRCLDGMAIGKCRNISPLQA